MSSLDKAVQTQLDNIQKKTGKSLDELAAIVKKSGLTKHGEIRDYLKRKLGLGHGDANMPCACMSCNQMASAPRKANRPMQCWMKSIPARRRASAPFTRS